MVECGQPNGSLELETGDYHPLLFFFFFFKIYLFLERGKVGEREGEKSRCERNISWLSLARPLLGTYGP